MAGYEQFMNNYSHPDVKRPKGEICRIINDLVLYGRPQGYQVQDLEGEWEGLQWPTAQQGLGGQMLAAAQASERSHPGVSSGTGEICSGWQAQWETRGVQLSETVLTELKEAR